MQNHFDPLELARETEKIVCRGNKRKYLRFGTTPDYGTGVATGYTIGCNFRCIFCAGSETINKPDMVPGFYSPEEVFMKLSGLIDNNPKINVARISDGEPTIGRDHLLGLLELVEKSDIERFFLETNGIILGGDEQYVKDIAKFKKVFVRVSLKAGTPELFGKITRADPKAYYLPFQALRYFVKHKLDFGLSALTADPRIYSPLERISLITRLGEIDPALVLRLEEEMTILFPSAIKRLKEAGWSYENIKRPFYLRGPLGRLIQIRYEAANSLQKQKISYHFTRRNIIQLRHGF